MAFLENYEKVDLQVLAEEIRATPSPDMGREEIIELILKSPHYEEEYIRNVIETIRDDRKMQESYQKIREEYEKIREEYEKVREEKEREREEKEREREFELRKLKNDLESMRGYVGRNSFKSLLRDEGRIFVSIPIVDLDPAVFSEDKGCPPRPRKQEIEEDRAFEKEIRHRETLEVSHPLEVFSFDQENLQRPGAWSKNPDEDNHCPVLVEMEVGHVMMTQRESLRFETSVLAGIEKTLSMEKGVNPQNLEVKEIQGDITLPANSDSIHFDTHSTVGKVQSEKNVECDGFHVTDMGLGEFERGKAMQQNSVPIASEFIPQSMSDSEILLSEENLIQEEECVKSVHMDFRPITLLELDYCIDEVSVLHPIGDKVHLRDDLPNLSQMSGDREIKIKSATRKVSEDRVVSESIPGNGTELVEINKWDNAYYREGSSANAGDRRLGVTVESTTVYDESTDRLCRTELPESFDPEVFFLKILLPIMNSRKWEQIV